MNKISTLFLLLLSCSFAKSQIIYSEDFSDGSMPSDYQLYNLDGLTPDDPDLSNMVDSAWTVKNITAQGFPGGLCAFSVSWYVGDDGPSDDWMVLPEITLGDDPYLSWIALAITSSGDFRDQYQIFVSSTGSDIEDYILLSPIFDTGAEGELDEPTSHEISLADFAGETVNIAFRNWTQPYNPDLPTGPGNGGNELAIDNITVSNGPVNVSENVDVSTNVIVYPNPVSIDLFMESDLIIDEYVVTNSQGAVICRELPGKSKISLDVSTWAKGSYSILFVSGSSKISKQFVIQ
jgi:hypothetical protein